MQYSIVTDRVVSYIKSEYGCEPEFLWARTPTNAAIRHHGNRKWFAALLLDTPKRALGLADEGRVDVLNLKCDPVMIGSVLDGKRFFPGYHMNKEHWISLLLDGSIPQQEITALIDLSFRLTDSKR